MMSLSLFNDITRTIESNKIRDCQDALEAKYPTLPYMTLGSLLSNYVQRKMKSIHPKYNTPQNIEDYYRRFQDSIANKEKEGIIVRLSDEIGITPALTARFILEGYLLRLQTQQENDEYANYDNNETLDVDGNVFEQKKQVYNFENIRSEITRLLRNTDLIEDKHVAYEVYLCLVYDDQYGPCPDVIKSLVGSEYEEILMRKLKEKGISYMEEEHLRQLGYDKTPDFKLDIPIAIEGRVVNWIESKATFGDEETHKNYLNEQITSYFNRFGPGLVIYWLGYVETLESNTPKGIFIRDHLPTAITRMNPTVLTLFPLSN